MIIIKNKKFISQSNRGMELENSISNSNFYYLQNNKAYIFKKPTPINVVEVKKNIITKAYFEHTSTLDFCGVYQGRYIEFEAKSTQNKTSFPLENIQDHQYKIMDTIIKNGGIAFLIIEFSLLNEYYMISYKNIKRYIDNNKRKSIELSYIKEKGFLLKESFNPRLNYLDYLLDMDL